MREEFSPMASGDPPLASLIRAFFVIRLVTVSFIPAQRFANLITAVLPEF
jgi:hypothetical protein